MAASTVKKVEWIFDPDSSTMKVDQATSTNAELESRFEFRLEVYKDNETHVESMKITNKKDGVENGSITTSIVNLEKDIKNFKMFGVVIGDTYFRRLANEIEKHYLDIRVSSISFSKNDHRFDDLIRQVQDYFEGLDAYIDKDSCYIPVNDFNGLADDCEYCDYEMRTLREQLVQEGYIHKKKDRYTMLKRIKKDKPERVIVFDREKLDVKLPEPKGKRSLSNGDGDE